MFGVGGDLAHVVEAGAVGGGLVVEDPVDVDVLVVVVRASRRGPVLVSRNVGLEGGLGLGADADRLAVATASRGGRRVDVAEGFDVRDGVEGCDGVDVVCVVAVGAGTCSGAGIGVDDDLEGYVWVVLGGIVEGLPACWGFGVDVEWDLKVGQSLCAVWQINSCYNSDLLRTKA